ncbi:MAG TPA: sulfatase-like hydrolase/transferase, partial [Anaerolineaceae bacterium]|nr:sulfatase-like hydrolase/transferase [Anaerolineaceae bacterium]
MKELIQQPERAIPAAGEHVRPDAALLARSAVNTLLMAFFYVFMEWVFFITKPSFMDVLSLETKLSLPLMTGLAASLPLLLALALIFVLDLLIRPRWPALRRHLYALPAGLVSACLVLILLDNFTYTLFRFGIVTVPDAGRAAYGLLFAFMVAGFTRYAAGPGGAPRRWKNVTALILSLAALLLTGLFWQPVSLTASAGRAVRRPNIILLSTDGLNAANMSVYGYERDTTPFIRQLAAGSLVAMNHFTNAAHSTGSDVSLLTGKLPLVTRVLYPPDTLQGIDSYQHLPGILRRNGYRTVSLGVPYFVDMNTVNFQEAFDAVNCQATPPNPLEERLARFGLSNTAYLLDTLQGRIADRIRHIYFIEDMTNPIELVEQPGDAGLDDQLRLECLRADLEQARETGQP